MDTQIIYTHVSLVKLQHTVTPEIGRPPPSRVHTGVEQGSVETLTVRMTGGSSCWMKENPRHGSGATANDVVIVGATECVCMRAQGRK